ncbi:MAG: hypothetical protein U5L09_10095 [Bacteroidales bacterium]|nr:hypothetical protein [Bacteroidales bacterium]
MAIAADFVGHLHHPDTCFNQVGPFGGRCNCGLCSCRFRQQTNCQGFPLGNKNQFHFKFDENKSWEQEKEEERTCDWSKSQKLTANYEDVANASLEFDAGAGTFSIEGNSGEYLAVFHKKGNAGRYSMKTRTDGDHQHIDFKLKNKNIKIPDNEYNSVEALLHTAPAWDFDFNIGAAGINFRFVGTQ